MKFKLLLLILSFSIAKALVVTDGTVGSVVTLDGADVTITQDLGKTSGNNLFHSFKTFDIDTGNKVTFTGSDTLENVISRVTGGEISTLDGTLKSNIGSANFYFFNPAGILLGPNSSIDVPASLHISTADYLTLENGDIFSATNPNESTLGIAKPEAFGYLDRAHTSLVFDGAKILLGSNDIELSSHDIEMKNASSLWTQSGNIDIYAQDIVLDSFGSSLNSIATYTGNINIQVDNFLKIYDSSRILSLAAFDEKGGDINIKTKNLLIDAKSSNWTVGVLTQTKSSSDAGVVDIEVNDTIEIYSGGEISSRTFAEGDAGLIKITTNELIIDDKASVWQTGIFNRTQYSATGDTGLIDINIESKLELLNASSISNSTSTSGNASGIKIKAQDIKIDNYSGIYSIADKSSLGDSGLIDIEVSNLLELSYSTEISSGTFGAGNAGDIKINAKNIKIDAENSSSFTGISSNANLNSLGNAGDIEIKVDNLIEVYNGAEIASNTFSVGDAGNVNIVANDIFIDDKDSTSFSGISSTAQVGSSGLVGNINIDVNNLELHNRAEISISHFGNLSEVNLLKNKKGNLNIDANTISLDRALISADSIGNASASDIDINAANTIHLKNSQIITSANTNTGGDIFINSGVLFMQTGFIQANTNFGMLGGNIYIDSDSIVTRKSIAPQIGGQKQDFSIYSDKNIIQAAAPQGNPGNLNIKSPKLDLTSSLAKLSTHYINISELIKDTCSKESQNKNSLSLK